MIFLNDNIAFRGDKCYLCNFRYKVIFVCTDSYKEKTPTNSLSRDSCTYGCVDGGFLPVVLPTSNHPTINAGNRGARRPKQSGPGMLCHQAQIAQPEPGTPCHSIAVWCPAHAQQVWRLCQSRLALTSSSQRSGTALSCNIYHQCFCNFQPLWEGPQRVQPWPRCGHREAGLL